MAIGGFEKKTKKSKKAKKQTKSISPNKSIIKPKPTMLKPQKSILKTMKTKKSVRISEPPSPVAQDRSIQKSKSSYKLKDSTDTKNESPLSKIE